MKTLLCIRSDYLTSFAGDSRQLLETAAFLRRHGADVQICTAADSIKKCDAVHLFNLTRITETYAFFQAAVQYRKRILLTPIFWDLSRYYQFMKDEVQLAQWEYYKSFRREILQGCSMVCPSGRLEETRLCMDSGTIFPSTVVPCGVFAPQREDTLTERIFAHKPYLFCSARICPRKNQLALCKAANQIGINVVLAGKDECQPYLTKCLAYPNVFYAGFLRENQLWPIYRNAALHVLCSFVETPGLSSLEAGLAGADLLSTSAGNAYEYFGEDACYCDPYNESSLKDAILTALSKSKQPALQQRIREQFLWENALQPLQQVYRNFGLCPPAV